MALLCHSDIAVNSQTCIRNANANSPAKQDQSPNDAGNSKDVVKVDVGLVKVDALVMQKKTARIVGGLMKDDFLIYEDGVKQKVTYFSKDTLGLPLHPPYDKCYEYQDERREYARRGPMNNQ